MAIEDRSKVVAGVKLVARYKGDIVECTVGTGENGELTYTVGDKTFNSTSKAGSYAAGGTSVNGFRFWSLDGELPEGRKAAAASDGTPKAKGKGKANVAPEKRGAATPNIKRARKQPADAPEGEITYFCSACMKSFTGPDLGKGRVPAECPEGHARNFGSADEAGQPSTDGEAEAAVAEAEATVAEAQEVTELEL